MNKKIKVMVVDDSSLFRQMIMDQLATQPDMEIVGYAINAYDARKKIPELRPDVISMDIEMPGLNGIDFLKQLLPTHPIPVVLVSSLNITVFDALSSGAVDFVPKPDMSKANSKYVFYENLVTKIRGASHATVRIGHSRPVVPAPSSPRPAKSPIGKFPAFAAFPRQIIDSTMIAIGASTGGTEATLAVLERLPAQMPGIVVTQHMPEGFTAMYAQRLNRICNMEVREARHGDLVQPGVVLIAPGSKQMEVVRSGRSYMVKCMPGAKVSGHCPSVDVLFSSVAQNVSVNKVGIILTGMGRDGADGLLKMRQGGAFTIGQDKESCVVYGMPMEAHKIGAVCKQASCDAIPSVLMKHLSGK